MSNTVKVINNQAGAARPEQATEQGRHAPSVADESSLDQWNAWSKAVRQRSVTDSESVAPIQKKLKLPIPKK